METFWRALERLQEQLDRERRIEEVRHFCLGEGTGEEVGRRNDGHGMKLQDAEDRARLIEKIENVFLEVIQDIGQGQAPKLTYRRRDTWDNIRYTEGQGLTMVANSSETTVRFDNLASSKRFALTLGVLGQIHRLLQTNSYCTKRDLYYQDPQRFGTQSSFDSILDNITCMLAVPRSHLHVLATSKGLIRGSLRYVDHEDNCIECSDTTTIIPAHIEAIHGIQSDARYILLVEKDATFQRLMDHAVHRSLGPSIIITGKGFPDVNTRLMVKRLWDALHIPVLALVDADPHGIEILMVYKYGSRSFAFDSSSLIVPSIKWLGLWPSDVKRLNVPQTALIPLTQSDVNKGQELLKRPYMEALPSWKYEIQNLLASGVKAEIQCLDSLSSRFLVDMYLPTKLSQGGWA